MASMRDIKRRKESVQSTEQITKAMKLVSSVKLTKAKQNAEESKPYFDTMYETVAGMIAKSGQMSHPFLQKGKSDKKAVIVVSSNRGLAGGSYCPRGGCGAYDRSAGEIPGKSGGCSPDAGFLKGTETVKWNR